MGGALLEGWFRHGLSPVDVMVVEPAGRSLVAPAANHPALVVLENERKIPTDFNPDVVVFAVKPQVLDKVIPYYRIFDGSAPLFLSIVAGKPISAYTSVLGEEAAVVRAMPNTPAAVGRGISVLFAGPTVAPSQKRVCTVLLGAVGDVTWIDNEELMDAVTAVSGSGPAYVFLLAECLAEAGKRAGLPPDLAESLGRLTVAGAGVLMDSSEEPASELRRIVTSPGGTTQAALEVLMASNSLEDLLSEAVTAAARKSRELAG